MNTNDFMYVQKVVNTGIIEDFAIKRLKNKEFYFVTERVYDFLPNLTHNLNEYPHNKTFRKRFIIKHKNAIQTSLIEDFSFDTLGNSGYETLEYKVNGSPFIKTMYCDRVSKEQTNYIKRISKNPFEINQTFDGEKMFEITDTQLQFATENPFIGIKIFERKLRKEKQQNSIWEV
jgi:hypothetical protein